MPAAFAFQYLLPLPVHLQLVLCLQRSQGLHLLRWQPHLLVQGGLAVVISHVVPFRRPLSGVRACPAQAQEKREPDRADTATCSSINNTFAVVSHAQPKLEHIL